jgi:hypothetical protein
MSFTCTACGRMRAGSVPDGRQWCGGGSEPACEPAPLIPDHAETVRLVAIAERIREMLSSWKKNTPRGDALCACLVLVGSEAGYEDAHGREAFLARCSALLAWSFDLGADAKRHQGERS